MHYLRKSAKFVLAAGYTLMSSKTLTDGQQLGYISDYV
jgi:hypothetical protein